MTSSIRGSAVALLLCLFLAAINFGCSGSSSPNVMVTVAATSNTVTAGSAAGVTATVTGDTTGEGVNWSFTCSPAPCGSVSPLSTSSGVGTTYTAPTAAPAKDLKVTVTATSTTHASSTGSVIITVPAISVSVSQAAANVQAGATAQFSATVNNDPSGGGASVNWKVSCSVADCGTISATSIQSGISITYTAPTTPPASDLSVTLTATSATDNTKAATIIVTVPAVVITVAPATATVIANGTTPLVATDVNDPTNKGVTWTVSCPAAPCGSVSPTATASGAATTFTAPPLPASDVQVTVTATSVADPTAMTSATVTVPAITVTVQAGPAGTNVAGNSTAPFTATVGNDPNGKGVTWTVSCSVAACGSVSPTATASGAATTYSAPPPPASDMSVILTATSVTDTLKSGTIVVTVRAIQVSAISPNSGIIPINATQPFTATVNYDASNQGMTWTLTQNSTACSPACGTVSPTNTASGTPTTYTAPSAVPSTATVTLNATSVADTTKTATAAITLTNGTVMLTPASLSFSCKYAPRNHCPPPIQTITLTNTGTSAVAINSIAITGTTEFAQTNTCGASVNAGAPCTVTVAFNPTKIEKVTGDVSFTDSSTDSPQQVAISGNAYQGRRSNQMQARSDLAATTFAAAPAPTGPSKVGTQVLYLTDAAREDPYLANGAKRELSVRLWYPASANSARDCKAAEYASPAVWSYFAHLVGVPPFPVATNSCWDAPVADGVHPVVLFTPGYTATATDYTFLIEDLASRGYVVASINHTYEATAVELQNGRLARSVVGSHLGGPAGHDGQSLSAAVAVRLQDLKSVVDEIEHLNAQRGGAFAGKLDLTKIVIAGHSLGGLTAFQGIGFEPRLKAAVMLDGLAPDALGSATRKPVLILAAGRQKWDAGECRLWSNLQGPRLAINLQGTEHVAFSDWIWLTKDSVQVGPMGPERTMQAIRDYVAEFLDANLRNESAPPQITGPSAAYPDAVLTTQDQPLCRQP